MVVLLGEQCDSMDSGPFMCKTSTLPTDVSPAMGAPSTADSHICAQAAPLSVLSGMIANLFSTSVSQTVSQGRDTGRLGPHRMQIKVIDNGCSHSVPEAVVTVFMVSSANLGVHAHQCYSKTLPRMVRQGLLYPRLTLSYLSS